MDIVDLLTLIIAVATLVAIALGAVAYVTRRLIRARRSVTVENSEDDHRYFVRYAPDGRPGEDA